MRHVNEIVLAFDYLLTQLTLVELRVKVSKCKLWNPSKISSNINIPQGCILVIDGLRILGVSLGFQDFVMHFLDGNLFQDVVHNNDFPLLGDAQFENAQVVLDILSSCVICQPYFIRTIFPPFSFLSFLVNFNKKVVQICGDIMGPGLWDLIQGPLVRRQARLLISFGGIGFFYLWRIVPHLLL
jgi:hypothetical protein